MDGREAIVGGAATRVRASPARGPRQCCSPVRAVPGRIYCKEGEKMAKAFTIRRVGHIGIQVTNVDRSLQWYRDVLGLTLTGRWPMGESGEMAFMRFTDDHHN